MELPESLRPYQAQIDSMSEIGLEWGDVGRAYLMIHPDDLAKERFDRVALNLPCY